MTKKKNGRGQGATTAIFQAFLYIKKEAGRTGLLGVQQSHPHLPKHIFAEHTETIYFIKTIKED